MKRVYVDMDRVLCDFDKAFHSMKSKSPEIMYPQSQLDFFRKLEPIKDAIYSINKLTEKYDVWILTRPSIKNPLCYLEKRLWVEDHLGMEWVNKLIISPDKTLLKGDYLIDDVQWNFDGEQILFQSEEFPDWKSVLSKLM